MNYADFKALREPLSQAADEASKALQVYPSGPMGLTPDHVKASPAFRRDNDAWNKANAAIRAFDLAFMRAHRKTWPVYFKKDIIAERDAVRAARLAAKENSQ